MSVCLSLSVSVSVYVYVCMYVYVYVYQQVANIPQLVTRLRICPAPSWGTGLRILQPANEQAP